MARIVRARALPEDWVELEHPDVEGGTHRCAEHAVAHWEARGWRRVAPTSSPADPKAPAKAATKSQEG